ncbi:37-kD nucleoid-associated bacterial protein [Photobacterium piscicola]|uniref:37-kD nucleoid-associated bacterial protein n=1 Tax=Photobacterium piscicola TaxID=1378299 RepID=A0A1T5I377_9GAMM|nr:nucleoid-associated protein [Photobacterium piscicola]SKC33446.1 37-kD nucleoid-associated bacterial protein [Photobacterium piscicola]
MQLVHLNIEKICIHQIFQRNHDGSKKTPEKSSDFVNFSPSAMETFKQRVIDALGSQSKAIEMMIVNQAATDTPSLFTSLKTALDNEFINISYKIADNLAEAQKRKNLQGGIVVVFRGTFGSPDAKKTRSIIGIIKADIYSAYQKITDPQTKEISLNYVKEALLTPSTKLFKTAAFTEIKNPIIINDNLNNTWQVSISDHQISQADGKVAAQYFYEKFLGCGYPESSARNTKTFYEQTLIFIKRLDISNEEKHELNSALTCYLKLDKSGVIDPNKFAQSYFDANTTDEYTSFLAESGLPKTSFAKDTQYIISKLKLQKVSFGKSIKLTAPAEQFKKLVIIEPIEIDSDGNNVNWTKILIKEKMTIPQ